MKKTGKKLLVATVSLVCGIWLTSVTGKAETAVLYEENFDGYTAARTAEDDADPEAELVIETELGRNEEPDRVQITDGKTVPAAPAAHSEPNALKIASAAPSPEGSKEVQVHFRNMAPGKEDREHLVIDFWLYRGSGAVTGNLTLGAAGGGEYTGHVLVLYLRPEIQDSNMTTLAVSAKDAWEHYKVVANSRTDTWDFYLNDMDTPKKKGLPFITPIGGWTESQGGKPIIVIQQMPSVKESMVYLDDLVITNE